MVTGTLKPIFQREGLGLIAPADGARLLVDEIRSDRSRPIEIVVLARSGDSAAVHAASPATESAGDDPARSPSHRANGKMEPVFERRIDLGTLPVIRSHVIDGHAVLPMALILEWLAEGAAPSSGNGGAGRGKPQAVQGCHPPRSPSLGRLDPGGQGSAAGRIADRSGRDARDSRQRARRHARPGPR